MITKPQAAIFGIVKTLFPDAIIEHKILTGLTVDIYIPSLEIVIEYDGYMFHAAPEQIDNDKNRDIKLINKGIKTVRLREAGLPDISIDKWVYCVDTPRNNSNMESMGYLLIIFMLLQKLIPDESLGTMSKAVGYRPGVTNVEQPILSNMLPSKDPDIVIPLFIDFIRQNGLETFNYVGRRPSSELITFDPSVVKKFYEFYITGSLVGWISIIELGKILETGGIIHKSRPLQTNGTKIRRTSINVNKAYFKYGIPLESWPVHVYPTR
ncbi:hypothetical protein D3C78_19230 [compost metagenome]